MPDLLLEIGTEELPVSFLHRALRSLHNAANTLLVDARVPPSGALEALGTPRRIALRVRDLPAGQPNRDEEVVGPPWDVAFKNGEPTRAAEGFARRHGVALEVLRKKDTPRGSYVSAQIHEAGRTTRDVLAELLPKICLAIQFPKTMRWGAGDFAFGRPVHWVVALLDDSVVPMEFVGVASGRTTFGHRFLSPSAFELPDVDRYESSLADRHVMVSPSTRRAHMSHALTEAAQTLGGRLVEDEFLMEECASLVEHPFVVPGSFDSAFLELPDAVVVSVMRDHQRYFAVRDAQTGALLPRYLNVVNTAENPAEIAKGNDRVLRARLADAQFFVQEDLKTDPKKLRAKLDSVVFQSKLGTIGEKVERIKRLADWAVSRSHEERVKFDQSLRTKVQAAVEHAKLDLETLVVFEFPELQGAMGRFYAERAWGLDAEIAEAVEEHYKPISAEDTLPSSSLSRLVGQADRFDTLVGCFGIGLVPTGSADPLALRRAAISIIRISAGHDGAETDAALDPDIPFSEWVRQAYVGHATLKRSADDVVASMSEFFRTRLRVHYKERFAASVVDAALETWAGGSLRDVHARIRALSDYPRDSLVAWVKRVRNITKDASRGDVDSRLFECDAEKSLWAAFETLRPEVDRLCARAQYRPALDRLTELGPSVDAFFEAVMVHAEDEAIRENRLSMLVQILETVHQIAHVHKLTT